MGSTSCSVCFVSTPSSPALWMSYMLLDGMYGELQLTPADCQFDKTTQDSDLRGQHPRPTATTSLSVDDMFRSSSSSVFVLHPYSPGERMCKTGSSIRPRPYQTQLVWTKRMDSSESTLSVHGSRYTIHLPRCPPSSCGRTCENHADQPSELVPAATLRVDRV